MTQTPAAIILSCEGLSLSNDEKRFFASANPLGFILFARNCDTPDQIRALNAELRDCVGWYCPILIDQEGGRVQRLKPPQWQQFMTPQSCHSAKDSAGIARLIAADLAALNIDVNCAPCIDLLCAETHDFLRDRIYSDNPQDVTEKGIAAAQAYIDAGITPIVKHLPGHGRAAADSHFELPVVDTKLAELAETDFEPFRAFAAHPLAPQTWGMVAHVIYSALDTELAATVSPAVINYMRESLKIDQFLIADDISMLALQKYGNLADITRKTLESGCDATLYCAGKLNEMEEIMPAVPPLSAVSYERYDRSRVSRRSAA